MDHEVLLVLVGAGIALFSSLATLAVSTRLWRSPGSGRTRGDGPEAAEWTSRYVQAMREAAAAHRTDVDENAAKPQ